MLLVYLQDTRGQRDRYKGDHRNDMDLTVSLQWPVSHQLKFVHKVTLEKGLC